MCWRFTYRIAEIQPIFFLISFKTSKVLANWRILIYLKKYYKFNLCDINKSDRKFLKTCILFLQIKFSLHDWDLLTCYTLQHLYDKVYYNFEEEVLVPMFVLQSYMSRISLNNLFLTKFVKFLLFAFIPYTTTVVYGL